MKRFTIEIVEDEDNFPLEKEMLYYAKVNEMKIALWSINEKLRNWRKYDERMDANTIDIVYNELMELMENVMDVIED